MECASRSLCRSRGSRAALRTSCESRMTERGVTQRMVALRSGVNHSTISRLLDEVRQPTLATAMALLHVLSEEPVRLPHIIREDAS
jgi:transcriptional regulator with XRE-family HTH domain